MNLRGLPNILAVKGLLVKAIFSLKKKKSVAEVRETFTDRGSGVEPLSLEALYLKVVWMEPTACGQTSWQD